MKVLVNITNDKKDLVKAGNAVKGFKDVIGHPLTITGAIIYVKEEVNEKTGVLEEKIVSCIKCSDGEFVTSISPTVKNSLENLTQAYDEEEIFSGIDVIVKSKKSNGGRDFLYLDLI